MDQRKVPLDAAPGEAADRRRHHRTPPIGRYFHDGNIDALIATIPSCIGEEGELYPPITIGDNLKAKLAGSRAGQADTAAEREAARVRDAEPAI